MLYLFINQLGWLAFIVLLTVVVALYAKINKQLKQLRGDIRQLQAESKQHKNSTPIENLDHSIATNTVEAESNVSELSSAQAADVTPSTWPPSLSASPSQEAKATSPTSAIPPFDSIKNRPAKPQVPKPNSTIEPDERSLPIVTSLIHSIKNWFFGGNLVVRVGVLVLLVGVVLLLRLLSDYIEIPITVKLIAIGIIGLGLAGLGLKLAKNRFAYGITLQGAG